MFCLPVLILPSMSVMGSRSTSPLPIWLSCPSPQKKWLLSWRLLLQKKIPVSPRGAGTGLSGGATTVMGGISLVLTRMNRVLSVDPLDRVAVVQVGVTNVAVSEAALKHSLYFAPDPSSQSASTIGGNIAENSGGPHTLKYGMTTNHVMGLKVVLANGEVITLGGRSRTKEGLDLLGVFIGSEGTIGIATKQRLN